MGLTIAQVGDSADTDRRPGLDVQIPKGYGRRIGQTQPDFADCADDHLGRLHADVERDQFLHGANLLLCKPDHHPREHIEADDGRSLDTINHAQSLS